MTSLSGLSQLLRGTKSRTEMQAPKLPFFIFRFRHLIASSGISYCLLVAALNPFKKMLRSVFAMLPLWRSALLTSATLGLYTSSLVRNSSCALFLWFPSLNQCLHTMVPSGHHIDILSPRRQSPHSCCSFWVPHRVHPSTPLFANAK